MEAEVKQAIENIEKAVECLTGMKASLIETSEYIALSGKWKPVSEDFKKTVILTVNKALNSALMATNALETTFTELQYRKKPGLTDSLQGLAAIRAMEDGRPRIEAHGQAALKRLFALAQDHTGQGRVIAGLLLGCYDGARFPFDLTDLRTLDMNLFDDCLAVLQMDYSPAKEVYKYFDNGSDCFEQMARDYRIGDWK